MEYEWLLCYFLCIIHKYIIVHTTQEVVRWIRRDGWLRIQEVRSLEVNGATQTDIQNKQKRYASYLPPLLSIPSFT